MNDFLLSHEGGDYRFCYWGPTNSYTAVHSDVLNSFSWSYNVVGEKQWIFYTPSVTSSGSETDAFTIVQKSGEMIFVPSGWRHEVINLKETLSINHNWITGANIDKAWDVILCEINAIEKELNCWGLDQDLYLVRENMLRGCVGLNMSSYFVLILKSVVEYMEKLKLIQRDSNDTRVLSEDDQWECWFDLTRLMIVLKSLLEPERKGPNGEIISIYLELRLAAVLNDAVMASEILLSSQALCNCMVQVLNIE